MRKLMRTTERAPERTTAPCGGPPGCLLLGIPFMDGVVPPERGPRGEVVPLLLGASRRPGCLRFRSREVGCWAPWLNLRRVPRRPFASPALACDGCVRVRIVGKLPYGGTNSRILDRLS